MAGDCILAPAPLLLLVPVAGPMESVMDAGSLRSSALPFHGASLQRCTALTFQH